MSNHKRDKGEDDERDELIAALEALVAELKSQLEGRDDIIEKSADVSAALANIIFALHPHVPPDVAAPICDEETIAELKQDYAERIARIEKEGPNDRTITIHS